jgi:hypothetical protein
MVVECVNVAAVAVVVECAAVAAAVETVAVVVADFKS